MITDAQYWIDQLDLLPHPEGGWYRETYRSKESIPRESLPQRFCGDRNFSTAIYFLLRDGEFSAFHTIKQDEIWHFHCGSPVTLHIITPDGDYRKTKLGIDPDHHSLPQIVVHAGHFFAVESFPGSFTLMSCTVAPGFDFTDFEMPDRQVLTKTFPRHRKIITRLTRE